MRPCAAHGRFDCWVNTCTVAETARDSHTTAYDDSGGYIRPGAVPVLNSTDRDEPVLTGEQWTELRERRDEGPA